MAVVVDYSIHRASNAGPYQSDSWFQVPGASSSGPVAPAGYSLITYNGNYVTYNGDYLMVRTS